MGREVRAGKRDQEREKKKKEEKDRRGEIGRKTSETRKG